MSGELSTADVLSLGLSRLGYALSRALRLDRLRALLGGASINLDEAAVWLLGRRYSCPPGASEAEQEEALARLLHHFQSIAWMTYRTAFTPIAVGEVQLRSDAGWGCTLRSGQMVLAQGLQRHLLGRDWRWPQPHHEQQQEHQAEVPPDLKRLLQLFWDTPAERHPFSLHNLCLHGRRCGVLPGRWLGPWVMCRTLKAAAAAAQVDHDFGVTVAVLAEPGGGAPLLVPSRFEAAFESSSGGGGSSAGQDEQQQGDEAQEAAAEASYPDLVSVDSTTLAVESPSPAAALAASTCQLSINGGGGGHGSSKGLILLVPLVLGLGKLNPRYAPQLEAVLTWPQSIGIVGGRPSSSLYFVGFQAAAPQPSPASPAAAAGAGPVAAAAAVPGAGQRAPAAAGPAQQQQQQQRQQTSEAGTKARPHGQPGDGGSSNAQGGDGSSVIYLDPHSVQEAACSDGDWLTFRCEAPRSMPLVNIDPSLAIGFYCGSLEEYRDLCDRLTALERQSGGAPLVCVTTQEAAAAAAVYDSPHGIEFIPDEMSSEDEEGEAAEEEEEEPAEVGREEVAAAAAEEAAATAEEARQRQRRLEEEPEVVPAAAAAAAAGAAGAVPAAAGPVPGGSPPTPPPPSRASSTLRQLSVSSRGWEVL